MALLCASPGVAPSGFAARREKEGLWYPRHVDLHGPDSGTGENPARARGKKGGNPPGECFLRIIFLL
jgi:hypothetical protein